MQLTYDEIMDILEKNILNQDEGVITHHPE